jgi:hypothetical protein
MCNLSMLSRVKERRLLCIGGAEEEEASAAANDSINSIGDWRSAISARVNNTLTSQVPF